LYGELGGQSRVAEIGAIAVYLELLYTTDAPEAYAVQLWKTGTPAHSCADAGDALAATPIPTAIITKESLERLMVLL
jgi:hypothetical protein